MSTLKTVNIQHPNSSNINMVLASDGSVSGGFPAGGRNKIINGGFDVWQRGTSFDMASDGTYSADRWVQFRDGSGVTRSITRQSMPLNTIPGYQFNYFLRFAITSVGTGNTYNVIDQRIEDGHISMSNQTFTLSFWAKADSSRTINTYFVQYFGSGGSADVVSSPTDGQSVSLTTSWQRFTKTISISSAAGKTIGTNPFGYIRFAMPSNIVCSVDIAGVQLEKGLIATEFEVKPYGQELRECQRYYQRKSSTVAGDVYYWTALCAQAASLRGPWQLPVPMRITPTLEISSYSHFYAYDGTVFNVTTGSSGTQSFGHPDCPYVNFTTSGLTIGRAGQLLSNNSSAWIAWTAEL